MVKFSIYLTEDTKKSFDDTLSHIVDTKGNTIARGKAIEILINHLTPTYITDVIKSYGYRVIENTEGIPVEN